MTSGEHTKGADLLALADRVEKLTGPDREFDGLIYGAIKGLRRNDGTFMLDIDGERFQFEHPTLRHPNGPGALYVRGYEVPEYTASLDAAMTLVPKGYGFSLDYKVKDHTLCEDTTYACVRDVKKALDGDYATISTEAARHLSPTIALTAACLRAQSREAQAGGGA